MTDGLDEIFWLDLWSASDYNPDPEYAPVH